MRNIGNSIIQTKAIIALLFVWSVNNHCCDSLYIGPIAVLSYQKDVFCNGVLISKRTVVTAGHCIDKIKAALNKEGIDVDGFSVGVLASTSKIDFLDVLEKNNGKKLEALKDKITLKWVDMSNEFDSSADTLKLLKPPVKKSRMSTSERYDFGVVKLMVELENVENLNLQSSMQLDKALGGVALKKVIGSDVIQGQTKETKAKDLEIIAFSITNHEDMQVYDKELVGDVDNGRLIKGCSGAGLYLKPYNNKNVHSIYIGNSNTPPESSLRMNAAPFLVKDYLNIKKELHRKFSYDTD